MPDDHPSVIVRLTINGEPVKACDCNGFPGEPHWSLAGLAHTLMREPVASDVIRVRMNDGQDGE